MKKTSSLLVVSSFLVACGHTAATPSRGGMDESGVARNADGVPVVDLSGFVSDFTPVGPLKVDAKDPSTWYHPGEYGLSIYADPVIVDGKTYIGMARFCGGPTPRERKECLALQKRVRIERLLARLELAGGEPADPKAEKALPKPIKIEDEKSGSMKWLTLCDEACLKKAAKLGGVKEVTIDDVLNALNAKLKAEHDKKAMLKYHVKQEAIFTDAKAADPWWLQYSARLVPYIDGQIALIGVASVDPADVGSGPVMIKAARNRARAELAKALLTVVKTRRSPGGRTIETESDLDILGATVIGSTQNSDGFWALALCDHECLAQTFAKSEVELPLASLQPGPVEQ